jgi:hypothetical protein
LLNFCLFTGKYKSNNALKVSQKAAKATLTSVRDVTKAVYSQQSIIKKERKNGRRDEEKEEKKGRSGRRKVG